MKKATIGALFVLLGGSVQAEESLNVEGRNGVAIIASEQEKKWMYDGRFHYSPAYRAGDWVYFSGVVAGAPSETPLGREEFEAALRRAFESLRATLAAADASYDDVVKIRSFHVFDSPLITLDKIEQVEVMAEVKGDYIAEPHPAWTAVGTTALLPDRGLVEIEIVAYAPQE